MIVADTDVLIDYLEGALPGADWVQAGLQRGQLATTTVNCFEILSGARGPLERAAIAALLESIPLLPLDIDAARRAAEVRQQLERSGAGIGMGDSLIAGITLAHSAQLLTRNKRHFQRVPGLALQEAGH